MGKCAFDKNHYLAIVLQDFIQKWANFEWYVQKSGCIPDKLRLIISTPEIHWKFNQIIKPIITNGKDGIVENKKFVDTMGELLELYIDDFITPDNKETYFCKLYGQDCDANPVYFITPRMFWGVDKPSNAIMQYLEYINCAGSENMTVEYGFFNKEAFEKMLDVLLDKGNYDFRHIKCLTLAGFQDTKQFQSKMDKLIEPLKRCTFKFENYQIKKGDNE